MYHLILFVFYGLLSVSILLILVLHAFWFALHVLTVAIFTCFTMCFIYMYIQLFLRKTVVYIYNGIFLKENKLKVYHWILLVFHWVC